MQHKNAKQMPQSFYCRHMINGVAQYGDERILVTTDTIKKMMKTLNNVPVFVEHKDVDMENLQQQADGYVTDSFYNEADGWFWVKILAVSDGAHDAIAKGFCVSNAYEPTKWGNGGTCLNVPYDREVLDGVFNHLAIVHNPRYEEACIMSVDDFKAYNADKRQQLNELKNSKTEDKEGVVKMKFWKKAEVTNADDLSNAFVTLENGENKSVAEMAELVNANAEKAKEEEDKKENEADMNYKVKVGDNEMTVEELKTAYENMRKKQNEMDEEERKRTTKADEAKKTEDAEEAKNKKNALENAKKESDDGQKHVDALKNAINKGSNGEDKPTYDSRADQLARGTKRY